MNNLTEYNDDAKKSLVQSSYIKAYNRDVAILQSKILATDELTSEKDNRKHRQHTIRRRKKFVYHAADAIIEKGYWNREKRSLTKFHSNSLMYEYKRIG